MFSSRMPKEQEGVVLKGGERWIVFKTKSDHKYRILQHQYNYMCIVSECETEFSPGGEGYSPYQVHLQSKRGKRSMTSKR